ncbi:hypothetical protein BS78_05G170000 [Paspalum vaginatum]|nr:hypothetical protein BS78_05G170000 [Paspalum vaginatum]
MESKQGDDKSKWAVVSNHNIKRFTKVDIERITNNYRTIIGKGAFREVYKGVLEDNSVVAVKKFLDNVKESFDQELSIHREINHKNIVRLIGYCVEENALMMVTEYIPNGNLSDILHYGSTPISLGTRLRIAIECAEAFAYMHSYMYTQMIHGDIKSANILLDGNLKAKVSDFGISRLVKNPENTVFTQHVIGSIGYMDPLFARDGRLTVKSDVYSFGIVLVELITRKNVAPTSGEKANIADMFTNALANGFRGVREIFDAEIASQNNTKILQGVARLAGECLQMERDRRPEMTDVVERLRILFAKASHQEQRRVDFFSWVRKSNPTIPPPAPAPPPPPTPASVTIPELVREFSFEEIKSATGNFHIQFLFDDIMFRGVFYGWIDGGATKVAVKRTSYHGHEFVPVIKRISKLISHHHIVPLIGYCGDEDGKMIVVYDITARGSLHHHLHEVEEPRLTWKQRLEICIGAARGLHHLHRGTKHSIQGNLESTNILLDENWVAKITDGFFPDGTYSLDPENTPRLDEKSDVLAFGALLFEVLSAKANRSLPKPYMLMWALRYMREGRLTLFLEPCLRGTIDTQSLNKFAETAAKCIADKAIDRPSMEDVLSDLECALQLQMRGRA